MSSDVTSTRRAQQDELADLQTDYTRRRKKLVQQQEEEINGLRANHQERREQVVDEGEAAINHIRDNTRENLEAAQGTRHKVQERSQEQLNKIEELYRKKIAEGLQAREAAVKETREEGQAKVSEIEQKSNERLFKVKERGTQQYEAVKAKSQQQVDKVETRSEQRLQELRAEAESKELRELDRGRTRLDQLHERNEKDFAKTSQVGESKIQEKQQAIKRQDEQLEKEATHSQEHKKAQWEHREKSMDEQYGKRLADHKSGYEDHLHSQKKRFDSVYTKNEEANRKSLGIQRLNAAKEMNEVKKDFLRDLDKYSGKVDDPFYKVLDRGSRLREIDDAFVMEAYVPQHEKDGVKVVIDKNKAIVQGQRAFQDKTEDDDGKKVSTSSYQSFREEFPFTVPVVTKGLTRERDGDWIRIVIPKMQTFSKKA